MINKCLLAVIPARLNSGGLWAIVVTTFLLFASSANAVVVNTTFADDTGTGATSFAIALAGSREAYADAIAGCDSSVAGCAAAASAFASTSYDVTVGATAAFYGATGLSVGSNFLIPLEIQWFLGQEGNATASISINGNTEGVTNGVKSDTWNFFVAPGGGVNIILQAEAQANASTLPGPYVQESFAYADPIISISSAWEWAAFSDLIDIEEFLDPVESKESGIRPDGYSAHLPPGSALLPAVPIPGAVWLFGTALFGLIGFGRRSKAI